MTTEPNSLQEIKRRYASLSRVERKIADFILEQPEKIINCSIGSLAAMARVSEGSIIKFSNHMGFNGFTRLKINIAQNLAGSSKFIFDDINPDDTPASVLHKMAENAAAAFRSTAEVLSGDILSAFARQLLETPKRIEIYGVGSSSMVAQDAYFRLMRIGLPAYAVTDSLICSVSASLLDKECTALGISHSGRTIETLRAMEIAASKGAKTMCITSSADSPLAKLCDISIVIASKESEANQEAVISRLTHLLVLDSMCSYIAGQRPEVSLELIENTIEIFGEHRIP